MGALLTFCAFYTDPEVEEHREELFNLGITQFIINYLHAKFLYYDINRTGLLDWSAVLAILYENDGPFMKRLLRKFMVRSANHRNHITFMGFLLGVWNILTLNVMYLPQFVFELYDDKNEGFISGDTVKLMVAETYHHTVGKQGKQDHSLSAEEDIMDIVKFTSFCHEHTYITKPIFDIIARLKNKLVGSMFWEAETRKRMVLFDNRYLTLDQSLHELRITIKYSKIVGDDGSFHADAPGGSQKSDADSPKHPHKHHHHDHHSPHHNDHHSPHHNDHHSPQHNDHPSPQHPSPQHVTHAASAEHFPHVISSSSGADKHTPHKHNSHHNHHAEHQPSHLTPQETEKLEEEFFGESDHHLRAKVDSHFYETPSSHDTLHKHKIKSQMELDSYHPHAHIAHKATTSPSLEEHPSHHHPNHHHHHKTTSDLDDHADSPHKHKPHHGHADAHPKVHPT